MSFELTAVLQHETLQELIVGRRLVDRIAASRRRIDISAFRGHQRVGGMRIAMVVVCGSFRRNQLVLC